MQRQHLSILAALPAALLFACAASAQGAPAQPPQQQMPPPPPAAQPQPQGMPPMQNQEPTQGARQGMGRASSTREFSKLAGRKGYVTRSEAASDPWLAQHFAQCDRKHNGKVTRSEYERCRKS